MTAFHPLPLLLRASLFLALAALALPAFADPDDPDWVLVWSDEFDGPNIDAAKWTHEVNGWGGGNNELQYYVDELDNSFISGGNLVIRAIKEVYTGPDGTRDYTSARLNTRFQGDWLYGRVEASARVPGDQGLWPAIWMLPSDWEYGGWAASGEIDIMEHRGDLPTTLFGTIHYGGAWPNNVFTGDSLVGPDLTQAFHEFAIEWDPGEIRWYLDDVLFQTQTSWWSEAAPYPAPFDKRFHIIVNLAVGGNFLPDPPADATYFPKDFEIDYIRVYQRPLPTQEPFGGTARSLPGRIEAEDFDEGGPAIAYHDTDPGNNGAATYRTGTHVDLEATTDNGGGYNVGWIATGEWLKYSVELGTESDVYFDVRVASDAGGGAFTLTMTDTGGASASRSASFPATGGWQTWTDVTVGPFTLDAGDYTLVFEADDQEFNINYFDVRAEPVPVTLSRFHLE